MTQVKLTRCLFALLCPSADLSAVDCQKLPLTPTGQAMRLTLPSVCTTSQANIPPPGSQSPFLHCLSKLNDDNWADILLPVLIQQRSAANLARSCTKLRDLCYSSTKKLNLSSLSAIADPSTLQDRAQLLPKHFKNCKCAQLCLRHSEDHSMMQFLLPELARYVCITAGLASTMRPCMGTKAPGQVLATRILVFLAITSVTQLCIYAYTSSLQSCHGTKPWRWSIKECCCFLAQVAVSVFPVAGCGSPNGANLHACSAGQRAHAAARIEHLSLNLRQALPAQRGIKLAP